MSNVNDPTQIYEVDRTTTEGRPAHSFVACDPNKERCGRDIKVTEPCGIVIGKEQDFLVIDMKLSVFFLVLSLRELLASW